MTQSTSDKVLVGTIAGAFGVQGDVRIKSFCSFAPDIFGYALTDESGTRSIEMVLVQQIKNGFRRPS
jgi:16S rRNA processing protein RimM